jgi:hypothetical protein
MSSVIPSNDFVEEGGRLMALIFVINSEGFRLNNLFQTTEGYRTARSTDALWQANLTDGKLLWDFGVGSTPSAALKAAWEKVKTGVGVPPLEASGTPGKEIGQTGGKRTSKTVISIPDLDL